MQTSFKINCLVFVVGALAPITACSAVFATQPAGEVDQIVVVFKTHFDIGYTDMAQHVVQRYRTSMIDQALEVCDRNRDLPAAQQFAWTLPGWPMSQIMADWPGQTAERKSRLERALRDGRFVVHGLPFTTHTELLEPEDLVRGLGFASRVSRAVSVELPRDAKMTDVPCHSWILPTLLHHAGIEFLHLGCNAASSSPQVPLLFWWEGPDGSRVLTMYAAEGYGTGLAPPKDWPYRTWLALMHTGDNHGPPKPEEVAAVLEQARTQFPNVNVRIGRLSDFADAIRAEGALISVVHGDMPDSWIHGPMCNPQGASLARNLRPQIGAAESLNTLLQLWGVPVDDAGPTIAAAYEQSLLYGEHTWGGALAWVSAYDRPGAMSYGETWKQQRAVGKYDRLEASWAEHTGYIESARDLVEPLLTRQLQTLAGAVRADGPHLVVFNPLPWPRSGLVSIPWNDAPPPAVRSVDDAGALPVSLEQGVLQFVARDVPAMGYRTYSAAQSAKPGDQLASDDQQHLLRSPFFTLTIDPRSGAVQSLVDHRVGHDWIDEQAPTRFGQFLYERFDRDQVAAYVKSYVKIDTAWAINELGKPDMPPAAEMPYQAIAPTGFHVRYERSPIAVSAVMESTPDTQLKHRVTTRVTLYRDLPCVDLAVTLHDKPADSWPEAGWICLPVKAASPEFRLGRLGSIIDPKQDVVTGANHNLLGLNTGLAVLDETGRGLGICPLDSPLVSLDRPGCWKYDPTFVPERSHVYVNLFNNQWTTNFRLWNEGTWTSRVRLWSLDEKAIDQSLTVGALESRYPLQAAAASDSTGALPAIGQGVRVSQPGVLVTAFGRNVDGDGVLLRLWELAGYGGPCVLQLPEPLAKRPMQPVDLRGQPSAAPPHTAAAQHTLPLSPFAPLSLRFEPQP